MFVDPLPADYTEGVAMFAGFRDHPDLAMVLDTPCWNRTGQGRPA
jgi:hypothetical protein